MKRYIKSSKFTPSAKANGEMAVRDMNQDAQNYYNQTDPIAVYEYEDTIFPDSYDYEMDDPETIKLYAIDDAGYLLTGLTFEEAENFLSERQHEYLKWKEEYLDGYLKY